MFLKNRNRGVTKFNLYDFEKKEDLQSEIELCASIAIEAE